MFLGVIIIWTLLLYIIILTLFGSRYLRCIWQLEHKYSAATTSLLISAILVPIAVLGLVPQPPIWWFYALGNFLLYGSLAFAYVGYRQLLLPERFIPIWQDPLIHLFLFLSCANTITIFATRDNLTVFISDQPLTPTTWYYVHQVVANLVSLYGFVIIMRVLIRALHHTFLLHLRMRLIVSIGIYVSSTTGALINILIIVFTSLYGLHIRQDLIIVTQFFAFTTGILLLLSLVPHNLFVFILGPIMYWIKRRQQYNYQQLAFLHQYMIHIVPTAHWGQSHLSLSDVLIEISDARSIIKSHMPYRFTSPTDEAQYLIHAIRCGQQFRERANPTSSLQESASMTMKQRDVLRYNLAVARCLQHHSHEITLPVQ